MRPRALLLAAILVPAVAVASVDVGTRAPDFRLRDLAGRTTRLSALRGRVVLLDFWASWCEPCKKAFAFYNRLAQRYGRDGLCVIGVSVDEQAENVRSFLRQAPARFLILHDPAGRTAATRYEPSRMPTSFLIDRNGTVRHVFMGFDESHESDIEERVRTLVAR